MTELDVCAAVIRRDERLLLATRPAGTHLAGKWEFPGGKCFPGESLQDCIVREIQEELGVTVHSPLLLCSIHHAYPTKTIRLHFLACEIPAGSVPRGREGQQCDWFALPQLRELDLAGADAEFVCRLCAPHHDPHPPAWRRLRRALASEDSQPCPPTDA